MQNLFPGYYRLTQAELQELWEKAIFVIDANVLLNLYRYPKSASDDLLRIFSQISDRLWLPYQAALEYQMNRLNVIAEQMKKYSEVKSAVQKSYETLENELDNLQLKQRHSTIQTTTFMEEFMALKDKFLQELAELETHQPDVYDDDYLRKIIDDLLQNRVGDPPASQDDLDKWYTEGEARYKQLIPPGYKDTPKSKDEVDYYIHNHLIFKRQYGDLMLWLQIINHAKDSQLKHVIFITDDDKADWWWISEKQGKKKIGVHPELVEEIKNEAGVSLFHMYSSQNFMRYAKEYLQVQINDELIEQVRDISRLNRDSEHSFISTNQLRQLLVNHLSHENPDDQVTYNRSGFPPILLVKSKDNSRIGYDVTYIRSGSVPIPFALTRFKDRIYRGYYEINENDLDEMVYVVVADSVDTLNEIYNYWERILKIKEGIKIAIKDAWLDRIDGRPVIMFPKG